MKEFKILKKTMKFFWLVVSLEILQGSYLEFMTLYFPHQAIPGHNFNEGPVLFIWNCWERYCRGIDEGQKRSGQGFSDADSLVRIWRLSDHKVGSVYRLEELLDLSFLIGCYVLVNLMNQPYMIQHGGDNEYCIMTVTREDAYEFFGWRGHELD